MKLTVYENPELAETEISIHCPCLDAPLKRLIEQIRHYTFSLEVQKDEETWQMPLDRVLYLETVDRSTFVYACQETYTCRRTLSELEECLAHTPFVRISRSCLLNTEHLSCVRPYVNHRLLAVLDNGENLLISRNYISALKKKLKERSLL